MNKFAKRLLILTVLFSTVNAVFADRGFGKRNKNRATLNVNTSPSVSLRNAISFNLRTGLSYKGSLLTSVQRSGNFITTNSIVTYQKGNTTYIIPYKNKFVMPEMRQGYSGVKLVIKSRK
ncbi:hypothetical protein LK994_07695 [Ferruginibacter lapsinanis]|uniref:hypothetical protein n=1 Tax=Ferruginibacter lapsinanis TaxID=563172 RepID=UPI001E3DA252|nr:hypothetical protein [Ferruginibacter lapsinanis]UEG48517.1 hypothetical protein LK994_07695 [Ferruginibacter lapsinanis]